MRRPDDGELHLLRGGVGVRGLQVFGGDEDAVTTAAQVHHRAGAPPGGQAGGRAVHTLHLNASPDSN